MGQLSRSIASKRPDVTFWLGAQIGFADRIALGRGHGLAQYTPCGGNPVKMANFSMHLQGNRPSRRLCLSDRAIMQKQASSGFIPV
jgi:hypothetical protein